MKNKQLFTLYIRALQSLQNVSETDDKSFFAVGGIHGLPYVTWNDATGSFQPDKNPDWYFGGYCTHGTVIFPTWHRPYVLLYEQLLQSLASQAAAKFTVNKDAWTQAAQQIRQPYWDWAQYALPPDEVIRASTVTITNYDGKDITVDNPLRRYTFKADLPLPYFTGSGWEDLQATVRQPDRNGKENITRLTQILNSGHNKTRNDVVLLLTNVGDWDGFSNHTSSENSITNSLERIHDNLHNQIGGNGHMADPAVAGFDPIFFLHHCNVDRMISLWSAVHPGVWVTPGASPIGGAFYLPPDVTVDTNTDLSPFWNSQSAPTFWNSSDVVSTSPLGYAYADFQGVDLNDPQAVRSRTVQVIQGYMQRPRSFAAEPPTAAAVATRELPKASAPTQVLAAVPAPSTTAAPAVKQAPGVAKPLHTFATLASKRSAPVASNPHPAPAHHDNTILNWTVRIRAKHNELGRSFSILVFIGPVPEDPSQWLESPDLVDVEHVFANSAATACANCRHQVETVSEGFVHLNDFIAQHHPELGSFDEDTIKPFLKDNLSWKTVDTRGEPVEISSLEVTTLCTPLSWDVNADFPTAGECRFHHDITEGKVGGVPPGRY